MNNAHPRHRINRTHTEAPCGDLHDVVNALVDALTEVMSMDIPSDYALAELVWLTARSRAEATAVLAKRLNVDSYDLAEAMNDPNSDAADELRDRLNDLVTGLVEYP
ncbi:hypothetical protein ACSHWG_02455 [Leucobacter sp. Z1108]|uniref:hypothetical protein n=1 Tax=Leucobacter sp. Z1108 TaxID=3439066 RepID=UPI003F3EE345